MDSCTQRKQCHTSQAAEAWRSYGVEQDDGARLGVLPLGLQQRQQKSQTWLLLDSMMDHRCVGPRQIFKCRPFSSRRTYSEATSSASSRRSVVRCAVCSLACKRLRLLSKVLCLQDLSAVLLRAATPCAVSLLVPTSEAVRHMEPTAGYTGSCALLQAVKGVAGQHAGNNQALSRAGLLVSSHKTATVTVACCHKSATTKSPQQSYLAG